MKKSKPKISVIIQNYNGENYLKDTIPSILGIKYPNWEILLVDNNSKDKSMNLLKKYKSIKVIKNKISGAKNLGLNLGIKNSIGEYLLFLDNDILINNKNILNELIEEYDEKEDPGFITLTLRNDNEEKIYFYGEFISPISFIKRNKRLKIGETKKLDGKKVAGIQGAAFFCKKDLFNKIGMFDEIIPFGGEDVDAGLRSVLLGFNNFIYSKSIQIHIGMNERQNREKIKNKYFSSNLGLFITIIKNYKIKNLLISLPMFGFYQLIKTIKDSIYYKNPKFIIYYFNIWIFLLKNRQNILKSRKIIQSKRIIKEDTFLKIKSPKI